LPVTVVNFSPTTDFVDTVYVDTNLIINARNRASTTYKQAASLFGYLISQGTNLFISSLVIDEIWWSTLRILYRNFTGTDLNHYYLKRHPAIIGRYSPLIKKTTTKVLRLPNVQMVGYDPNNVGFINNTLDIFTSEQLAPRDSFHLGLTMACNIQGFATGDGDFDNLTLPGYDLTVYKY